MNGFGAELTAARKAKGITQEQLAQIMNVTRPAVSHWETGRTEPDLDTIRRLTEILEYDFSSHTQTAPKPELSKKKRAAAKYAAAGAVIAAAVLAFVFLVLPLMSREPQALAAETPPEADTVEYYSSPCTPQDGEPYLELSFSENAAVPFASDEFFPEDGIGWMYELFIKETNGLPFTVTEYRNVIFKKNVPADVFTFDGETVAEWFGSATLPAGSTQSTMGGMPFDTLLEGIGILVKGTDEAGNELAFHTYLPLTYELAD